MKRLIATSVLIVSLLLAGVAIAGITVYKTSFQSRSDFESIRGLSGPAKQCKRHWRDKSALGVVAKGGPVDCTVSTPVQGDSDQPDLTVRVIAKLTKNTDKKVRRSAYLGVVVRASSRDSYELRIVPKTRVFELIRNGEVVQRGREKAIDGFAKKNRLQIKAEGDTITGTVNGKRLAAFRDRDANQVDGRQSGLSFGNEGRLRKGRAVGFFDKLKVQVPAP